MRAIILAAALLVSSCAYAQLSVEHSPVGVLPTGTTIKQVGDYLIVRSGEAIVAKPAVIIRVTTEADNVEVSVTDQARVPVEFVEASKTDYFLTKPGRYWVEVTAIDFAKNIYGRKTIVVEVGDAPVPPPGPSPPGPTPPGPQPDDGAFDGLAGRVNQLAVALTMDHRSQIAGVLGNAADKMRSFEFRSIDQAKEYISRNWPPCQKPECGELFKLVSDDAARRLLSWQETQEYYRTVAKGVL